MKKQYTTPAMFAVDYQSQGLLADSGTKSLSTSYTINTEESKSQQWFESPFDD